MSKFYRTELKTEELLGSNGFITVMEALKLIENSEYYDKIVTLFKPDEISDETIKIPGLKKLVSSIISKDEEFEKFDFNLHLSNVSLKDFTAENSAILSLILDEVQQEYIGHNILEVETVYNSRGDYFEGTYNINKFSKFCNKGGHVSLLKDNISYLNQHYKGFPSFAKKFRLLKDKQSNYYVRAITSTGNYYDYNIRFSLFIAIMALHNLEKTKGLNFTVNRSEYDESFIRAYFEKIGQQNIKGIGNIKFILELSNDEIKREAMLFSGLFSISVNDREESFNVYVKPKSLKYQLVSIKHNFKPETVLSYVFKLPEALVKTEDELLKDLENIAKLKAPDELRHLLQQRIERAKIDQIKEFKPHIYKALDTKINTITELLKLMNKVDLIVSDLEAKEYLRYLYFDILRSKKNQN